MRLHAATGSSPARRPARSAAAGIYELVDRLGRRRRARGRARPAAGAAPARPARRPRRRHRGARAAAPPPARHRDGRGGDRPASAQRELEDALADLDAPLPVDAGRARRHRRVGAAVLRAPRARPRGEARAVRPARRQARAAPDAIRFPSDPHDTVLEQNDVAVLLRSDSLEHISAGAKRLFDDLGVFEPTSIRKGFAGGGFEGRQSLPKRMAMAAGVPGADLIPDTAELFLGFTSTQQAGLGPRPDREPRDARLRGPAAGGYFRGGTHMHLSHIFEDLEAWYLNFDFQRAGGHDVPPGARGRAGTRRRSRRARGRRDRRDEVERDFRRRGRIGHSASIQTTSRLERGHARPGREGLPQGHRDPAASRLQHARQPVLLARPERDGRAASRRRASTSSSSTRRATTSTATGWRWTACCQTGRALPFEPGSRAQGFNSVLHTTHRQNFLVPPRQHRSFPLAEL